MDRYFEKNDLKKREKSNIKAELGLRNVNTLVTMPKTGYTVVLMQIADNSHKEILFR